MRPLTIFQPVSRPTGVPDLLADPDLWLPSGSRPSGGDTWMVTLHLAGLSRTVECRVGRAMAVGSSVWRQLTWNPISEPGDTIPTERLLPAFDGEIGLHRAAPGELTLILSGAYRVPLGVVGEAIDSTFLSRGARSTGARFLREIVDRSAQPTSRPVTSAGRILTQ